MAKKLSKKTRHPDLIPWDELTDEAQIEFEEAFMKDDARHYRNQATFGKIGSADLSVAGLLNLYSNSPKEIRSDVFSSIKSHLALFLIAGRWDKFKWLSIYGKKHAPDGIGRPLSWENKRAATFPEVGALRNPSAPGVEMAELILIEFVRLSRCSLDLIHYDSSTEPSQDAHSLLINGRLPKGRMRTDMVPQFLPTKGYLEECVLRLWEHREKRLVKSSSLYRRTLKKLGLSGLPMRGRELGEHGGQIKIPRRSLK